MSSFYDLIDEFKSDESLRYMGSKLTNGKTRTCAAFQVLDSPFYIFLMYTEITPDQNSRFNGITARLLERNNIDVTINEVMDVLIGCRLVKPERILDVLNEVEVAKSIIFNLDLFTK